MRWIALGALFLIPLTPLVVANSFFFPFITGKALYFRVLVEIAFAAWIALACIDRAYRPRFSWLGLVVLGFLGWMLIADAFALNPLKAFWSNFERMEGWVWLAHLAAFFFTASNVLRVEKAWRQWFLASLGVAVILIVHALFQLAGVAAIHQGSTRIDASFGNSAYFAVYLLFTTFVAGWLALTEERRWLGRVLLVLASVAGLLVFFTETRGAILGLAGACLLAALLTAVTTTEKVRRYALGVVALLLILVGGLYSARDSSFVEGSSVLRRIASISLADGETRFTVWKMAYQGFRERPVLGWGQEGFNYVFNAHYNPSLYQQEPWFDRAHNAFLDWLMAGGLPAFILYLSLFGVAIFLLWRSPGLSRSERIALTAALAAYGCHNFFVFDNLYSYIYFFAVLALIDSQTARPVAKMEELPEVPSAEATAYALPGALVLGALLIWFINVPAIRLASGLITAITPSQSLGANIATFEDLLKNPTFASQEIREQLVLFAASAVRSSASSEEKVRAATLAIKEQERQVEAYPHDARSRLQLAYAYRSVGDGKRALEQALEAAKLSPHKPSIWLEVGALAWDMGDLEAAAEYFGKAYILAPQFPELAAYAAAGHFVMGEPAVAEAMLIESYGTATVDNTILSVAYYRTKDWPRLIALWRLRASAPDASAQTLFGLASAYYVAGQKAEASAQVGSIIVKYPNMRATGEAILKQIEAGTWQ